MSPTDEDLLAALAIVRAWLGLGRSAGPNFYDQASHLPPGISKDAFLRLHRLRTRERAQGWSRRGKSRLVTSEAWNIEIARETSRVRRPKTSLVSPAANDATTIDAQLDHQLGIKTKRGATG